MNNFHKRILTSIIIFPLSIFIIFQGGYLLLSYLLLAFLIANYELFSVFKNKKNILFLDLVLILSLFSIYQLRDYNSVSFNLLIWFIVVTVCSDVGGYIFGKIFKWKKISKISPKKTLSGVIGSLIFSLISVLLLGVVVSLIFNFDFSFVFKIKYFILAIIFSISSQVGDLTVSFFKRLEKIKDTGKFLPGHGGIFDRIDGLMFVVILGYLVYILKLFP